MSIFIRIENVHTHTRYMLTKEMRKRRVYMSCRSYTVCRSCNFGKNFVEVTTSTDDVVEVITSTIIFAEV